MVKQKNNFAIIIIFIMLITGSSAAILYMYNYNRQHIHARIIDGRGVDILIYSQISPDGEHCLCKYTSEGKGATVGNDCFIIIEAKETGKRWKGKEAWSLFFGYRSTDIIARWIDNETIIICSTDNNTRQQFELKMNIYQDEF